MSNFPWVHVSCALAPIVDNLMTDAIAGLDPWTIAVVLALVSFLGAVFLLSIWALRPTYPGFGLWALAQWCFFGGSALYTLRGIWPDSLTLGMANLLTLASAMFILMGIQAFREQKRTWMQEVSVLAIAYGCLLYFRYGEDLIGARFALFSFTLVYFYLRSAISVMRGLQPKLRGTHAFASAVFSTFAVLMAFRGLTALGGNSQPEFFGGMLQATSFLSAVLLSFAMPVALFVVTASRFEYELGLAHAEVERLAGTDVLTGAMNRREFTNRATRRMCDKQGMTAIMLLDLDHFKSINDRYGHECGDAVLCEFVRIATSALEQEDLLARFGGEEFVVLATRDSREEAIQLAETLRRFVERYLGQAVDTEERVTTSGGVAFPAFGESLDEVLRRADAALYQAKATGRNRICLGTTDGITELPRQNLPLPNLEMAIG